MTISSKTASTGSSYENWKGSSLHALQSDTTMLFILNSTLTPDIELPSENRAIMDIKQRIGGGARSPRIAVEGWEGLGAGGTARCAWADGSGAQGLCQDHEVPEVHRESMDNTRPVLTSGNDPSKNADQM